MLSWLELLMEWNALLSIFSQEIETERTTVFSSNVIRGINFYLNMHKDTGVLTIIARDSGQLIQKHFTREMTSHTHPPLLVMHNAQVLISLKSLFANACRKCFFDALRI